MEFEVGQRVAFRYPPGSNTLLYGYVTDKRLQHIVPTNLKGGVDLPHGNMIPETFWNRYLNEEQKERGLARTHRAAYVLDRLQLGPPWVPIAPDVEELVMAVADVRAVYSYSVEYVTTTPWLYQLDANDVLQLAPVSSQQIRNEVQGPEAMLVEALLVKALRYATDVVAPHAYEALDRRLGNIEAFLASVFP